MDKDIPHHETIEYWKAAHADELRKKRRLHEMYEIALKRIKDLEDEIKDK